MDLHMFAPDTSCARIDLTAGIDLTVRLSPSNRFLLLTACKEGKQCYTTTETNLTGQVTLLHSCSTAQASDWIHIYLYPNLLYTFLSELVISGTLLIILI
ncbi:hypothetical protein HanIR_Chr17g0864731 [Helianthus annuus]|nr:hypothetical protein HanIR_Chr17g0864731 [Helianthus annuus]